MATLQMPTFKANLDHRYDIVIDGVTVILEFHHNARANRWSMNIIDIENVAIRHGVRLVTGIDLLQRVASAAKPPGVLRFVDGSGADTEPDLDTLGVQTQFRYVESA